jgi:N-acetylgalactosamine-6-sulfatase
MGGVKENGAYGLDKVGGGGSRGPMEGRDAGRFKAAMKFMESRRDVPFYVQVWGHIAHYPVDPHPFLVAMFEDLEVRRGDFPKHMQAKFDEAESLGGNLDEGMAKYLAEVYSLDVMVGELLEKLDDLGLRENTIVAFASDQGPAPVITQKDNDPRISVNMMGSAGSLRGGKSDFLEGGVRSPFIIRWPGHVPAGKVNTTSITSALDWLPTVAAIAGIAYDPDMFEGEDVSDIWKGAARSRKNPLFWRKRLHPSDRAMLQGDWKLLMVGGQTALYNLSENPDEDIDLADQHEEIFEELKGTLEDWTRTLPNRDGGSAVVIGPADIPPGAGTTSSRPSAGHP